MTKVFQHPFSLSLLIHATFAVLLITLSKGNLNPPAKPPVLVTLKALPRPLPKALPKSLPRQGSVTGKASAQSLASRLLGSAKSFRPGTVRSSTPSGQSANVPSAAKLLSALKQANRGGLAVSSGENQISELGSRIQFGAVQYAGEPGQVLSAGESMEKGLLAKAYSKFQFQVSRCYQNGRRKDADFQGKSKLFIELSSLGTVRKLSVDFAGQGGEETIEEFKQCVSKNGLNFAFDGLNGGLRFEVAVLLRP